MSNHNSESASSASIHSPTPSVLFEKTTSAGYDFRSFRNEQESDTPKTPQLPTLDPRFSSYVEYLKHVSSVTRENPCTEWLVEFFTNLPDFGPPHGAPTQCLIADAMEQGWRFSQEMKRETLQNTEGVFTRVLIPECLPGLMAWIDRDMLDVVAHHYALRPIHLWGSLHGNGIDECYDDASMLGECDEEGRFSVPLFEAKNILNLVATPRSAKHRVVPKQPTMFGIYLNPGNVPTCLVFSTSASGINIKSLLAHHIDDSYHPLDPDTKIPKLTCNIDVYIDMLSNMTQSTCRSLAQTPAVYLLKYLWMHLHSLSQTVGVLSEATSTWVYRSPEGIIDEMGRLRNTIGHTLINTEEFARSHDVVQSPEALAILAELKKLQTTLNRMIEHTGSYTHGAAASASLAESRRAIHMTDSVKLLTQLAFIFIPLTFSASIFGMNFKELGSGVLSITSFVATAFAVTGTTLVALWLSKAFSGKRGPMTIFALPLSIYSTLNSSLLLTFLLLGEVKSSWDDNSVSLDGGTPVERLLEDMKSGFEHGFRASRLTNSRFWQIWLLPLEIFFDDPEWKEHFFWQRWARRYGYFLRTISANLLGRGKSRSETSSSKIEADGSAV